MGTSSSQSKIQKIQTMYRFRRKQISFPPAAAGLRYLDIYVVAPAAASSSQIADRHVGFGLITEEDLGLPAYTVA
jgi:hypothetical protein